MTFDHRQYWDNRLRRLTNLEGVGCEGRSAAWNRILYRTKVRAFGRVISRLDIDVAGLTALDIGCGVGFWIETLRELRADRVVGVDIAPAAIEHCRERFKEVSSVSFRQGDFGSADFDVADWEEQFQLVTAFDVFYHIIECDHFHTAIANVRRVMAPGARFLVSDLFGRQTVSAQEHVVFRSLDTYREAFELNGLQVEQIQPVTLLLNSPVDATGVAGRLMKLMYYGITSPLTSTSGNDRLIERMWLGALYHLEAPLLSIFPSLGRSNRLLVARAIG